MVRSSLILMPGMDGTGILFRPILPELQPVVDVTVISYRQQNHARYRDHVDQVLPLLPDSDFFLLGESFSGPVALQIAARRPRHLKGIILCATFISNPIRFFPSSLSFLVRAPLFYTWPVSIKLNFITRGRNLPEVKQLLLEAKKAATNQALASRSREILNVNVAEELRQCPYPMLYLRGARDQIVPRHNFRKIQNIRPDIACATFDTSHMVLQEAPKQTASEILRFIRSVS